MSLFKVIVEKDLEDLIPNFLNNRTKDIETMKRSLEEGNYESIRVIGHSMKGYGSGYGFDYVSEAGAILENASKVNDDELISKTVAQLEVYFENVEISYE